MTAAVLIPQAMAYAQLAGLPPQVGLYAAMVAPFAYALIGTSPVLIVAPAALDSLLVATAIGGFALAGSPAYLTAALTLGLLIGVVQLALGLLGGGFLVNFLSRPVLSGFTSAAAIVIAAQQIPALLGVKATPGAEWWQLVALLASPGAFHAITAMLGIGAFAALIAGRRLAPKLPWVIVVLLLTAAIVGLGALGETGVAVVGNIPAGFPSFALAVPDLDTIKALLPAAAMIAFVSLTEGVSAATACRIGGTRPLRPNREFAGVGLANIASASFGGLAVAGGLSRTAVNWRAGAQSKLASLTAATIVAAVLLWFSGLFTMAPRAVLAAIIMVSVGSLIDVNEIRRLFRIKRADMWLALITAAATLSIGILEGIATGIAASMLWLIVRTTQPHTAVLGRLPGKTEYRNIRNYAQAITFPGILILRMDAQFYFGNIAFLKDKLRQCEVEQAAALHTVILDASGMNQLDSSAVAALEEINADYRSRGIQLKLANLKVPVRTVMQAAGLIDAIDPNNIHLCVHDAVEDALQQKRPTTKLKGESHA